MNAEGLIRAKRKESPEKEREGILLFVVSRNFG